MDESSGWGWKTRHVHVIEFQVLGGDNKCLRLQYIAAGDTAIPQYTLTIKSHKRGLLCGAVRLNNLETGTGTVKLAAYLQSAKSKGSNCSLYKWAGTAFWLCRAELASPLASRAGQWYSITSRWFIIQWSPGFACKWHWHLSHPGGWTDVWSFVEAHPAFTRCIRLGLLSRKCHWLVRFFVVGN